MGSDKSISKFISLILRHKPEGRMYRDGITFYRSVNGVWLMKTVPVEYLL